MSILSKTRAALNRQVPSWLAVNVDRHFLANLQIALNPPQSLPLQGGVPKGRGGSNLQSPHPKSPHWRRITQVYMILDRHLQSPQLPTYAVLIQQVQAETGTGCSRKLISKWKRDRGLR